MPYPVCDICGIKAMSPIIQLRKIPVIRLLAEGSGFQNQDGDRTEVLTPPYERPICLTTSQGPIQTALTTASAVRMCNYEQRMPRSKCRRARCQNRHREAWQNFQPPLPFLDAAVVHAFLVVFLLLDKLLLDSFLLDTLLASLVAGNIALALGGRLG